MCESLLVLLDKRVPGTIDAQDYKWEDLYGPTDIRKYGSTREVKRMVTVLGRPHSRSERRRGADPFDPNSPFGSFGTTYKNAVEGVEFTDGTVLVLAMCADWGGTFQSHDDMALHYYKLTPREEA